MPRSSRLPRYPPDHRLPACRWPSCSVLPGACSRVGASVLVRRAFDTGLTTGQDVERKLGMPYLTGVASLESTLEDSSMAGVEPHKYLVLKPLSIFAEGFRSLRAAVMYANPGKETKIVAITSALPGEGKTTTSICLGITMALSGQKAVVVDCDVRRRSLMALFRDKHIEKGLIEVLEGKATLEEVMLEDEQTGLKLLPIAPHSEIVKDIFGSEAMDRVLDELRANYDMIVLDTAPVLPVVDTRILARKADTVVLLVRWRHTPRKASQAALELLKDVQANIAGVALTQINVKDQARYGYGDSGYYYRAYKSYYSDN
jgi:polysaccharide biosynthesis transport protein